MSVTAVPLRPIKKGGLTKLWIGVGLAVAVAAGGAWIGTRTGPIAKSAQGFLARNAGAEGVVTTPSGLQYKVVEAGAGPKPTDADVVLINYKGMLTDDKVFDQGEQVPMEVTGVVPGFSEALKLMPKGSKYRFWMKPSLGYGDKATGPIPANSTLVFDIKLLDFLPESVVRQMQAQQGAGGMPGGAGMPGMPPQGPGGR